MIEHGELNEQMVFATTDTCAACVRGRALVAAATEGKDNRRLLSHQQALDMHVRLAHRRTAE